tara:strand:- start:449 stop:1135 length:687 start_codon:yes stop_codon:yes gene_type:complete
MSDNDSQKIYVTKHFSFFEKVLLNKRKKILIILKKFIDNFEINDVLDIGTTEDETNISSNYLIKNLGKFKNIKSISDQSINLPFFSKTLQKSITDDFTEDEIKEFQSDIVFSNAVIEHVGSLEHQLKMCSNIIKLTKKYFIICTPNRYHPIEFHTKIPLLHWLPKNIYRKILSLIGLKFFAKEENLNLLSEYDFRFIMKKLNQTEYNIKNIKFFFIKSNLILIGKKTK